MQKRKILVVEDDPQVLAMLGEALDLMGVQPHCLASSREAAELIQKEKFDGVFLDWLMPELNGLELAKRIRASEPNARCPIFMLTGNNKRLALRESFDVGINLFLQKPISLEHIRRLLNIRRDTALEKQRHHSRVPLAVPVVCKWEHRQAQGQSIKPESHRLAGGNGRSATPGRPGAPGARPAGRKPTTGGDCRGDAHQHRRSPDRLPVHRRRLRGVAAAEELRRTGTDRPALRVKPSPSRFRPPPPALNTEFHRKESSQLGDRLAGSSPRLISGGRKNEIAAHRPALDASCDCATNPRAPPRRAARIR